MGCSLQVQKFAPGSEESSLNLTLTRAFGKGFTTPFVWHVHWLRRMSGSGTMKQPYLSASYTRDQVPLDLRTGVAAQQAFETVLVKTRGVLDGAQIAPISQPTNPTGDINGTRPTKRRATLMMSTAINSLRCIRPINRFSDG